MSVNIKRRLYHPLFTLTMFGANGDDETFECSKAVRKQGDGAYMIYTEDGGNGGTSESACASLYQGYVNYSGPGPIIGLDSGNTGLGFPAFGCQNDGILKLIIDNFTSSAVTINGGRAHMYMMTPQYYVETDLY